MCRVLKISRSTYYYESKPKAPDIELVALIKDIFTKSRNNYGTRKIRRELKSLGYKVSRRRIGRIMKQEGLVSKYTVAQYKLHIASCNNDKIENRLDRKFNNQEHLQVVVSDLTYVRVSSTWHYICVLIDLFNREIIGYSTGRNKDARLVKEAFYSANINLNNIRIFHTDRGNEFKNKAIDEVLEAFSISRSLSKKGCPYDNAVAEATFKIIKTEFVKNERFDSLEELNLKLADYVNWFNNCRIHSSLDYLTPVKFKENTLKKVV